MFVHLHVHGPFSFLDGGSSMEELLKQAAGFEMPALALTDHNCLSGAVRFQKSAQAAGIKAIQGVEITLENGRHLTLLARNPRGYASLCRLVSKAHLDRPRGEPRADLAALSALEEVIVLSGCRRGELAALILQGQYREAVKVAKGYKDLWGENFYIELQDNLLPGNRFLNRSLLELARSLGIRPVATNNAHYASRQDFVLHDILTCIRTLSRVEDIHPARPLNGESHLKSPREMERLFSFCPEAIENTLRIAEICEEGLDLQKTHFPCFPLKPGQKAAALLRQVTLAGAEKRYGRISPKVRQRLESELDIIEKLGFPEYFLVVWDLACFARRRGIRYAGRGSAADSLVTYCLFITEVDSLQRGLLFERFMSLERQGLPDIDIDFEYRRRDEVIDYVYRRYGEERVARVATYNTFQGRSALREVGKALGFSEEELDSIAKKLPHTHADNIRKMMNLLPELKDSPLHEKRYAFLLDVCERIAGFPRFLGMHLGGVVISDIPLQQLTPLQKSALGPVICQFDKDDVEELGLIKLDLLSLRTLSVVQDTLANLEQEGRGIDYDAIPLDDPDSYDMIRQGETIGVFQLESPAQRALQARLEASHMEDIVASMALIRPGPIKGNMVEPYIDRRQGRAEVEYLHPALKPILEKTYGVVLFQEQVIEIAIAIAGFTPGEADQLRRVMTRARSRKAMEEIGAKFISRAISRGIGSELAEKIFSYIAGYASYGFCEAHAAAFATTSFKTAYLIRHYPAHYFAALLNNQPMGYYPPAILAGEARRRGIRLLPPDVNQSQAGFVVEGMEAIRTGLKQVKGITREALQAILAQRLKRPFKDLPDFISRTRIDRDIAENLIKCGALDSLHSNRRQMLLELPGWLQWSRSQEQGCRELFRPPAGEGEDFSLLEKAAWERLILGIDTEHHVMAIYRPEMERRGISSSREVKQMAGGSRVSAAGLLLRPHRPPTRSGKITVFLSLEDEFGILDVTVFEQVYFQYGAFIFGEQQGPLLVRGIVQRRGNGVSLLAESLSFVPVRH